MPYFSSDETAYLGHHGVSSSRLIAKPRLMNIPCLSNFNYLSKQDKKINFIYMKILFYKSCFLVILFWNHFVILFLYTFYVCNYLSQIYKALQLGLCLVCRYFKEMSVVLVQSPQ